MGDSRRFHHFARLIEKHIPKSANIADVAGGKGYLQASLRQLGYKKILSFDKAKKTAKNRKGYCFKYFHYQKEKGFDAVVAMHPDEATDHVIMYGILNKVTVIVCPCCVKPDAVMYNGPNKFNSWVNHLKTIGRSMNIIETVLPISGKSLVLIFKPKK